MPKSPFLRWSRLLAALPCLLAVLLLSTVARAAGRVVWNNKHPQERDDHSWHLGVKIYMSHPPSIPHIPVKFEFTPKAYYERDLVDGDKIVERKVPLTNNPAIIEDVDIGFLDPGTGKIQKRTKFTFKITRAHDFKAGEYQVKIRDSRSGHLIGRPITLILGGKNKPIDRRTMVFSGNVGKKKAKKKEDMRHVDKNGDVSDDGSGSGADSASSDKASDDSSGGGDDSAGSGDSDSAGEPSGDDTEPSGDNGADDAPPPIKEKPGCNCRIEASHTPADPALLFGALALLGGLVLRRRYR
jgi:hypothetical protein